jgi:hypothetical protein
VLRTEKPLPPAHASLGAPPPAFAPVFGTR